MGANKALLSSRSVTIADNCCVAHVATSTTACQAGSSRMLRPIAVVAGRRVVIDGSAKPIDDFVFPRTDPAFIPRSVQLILVGNAFAEFGIGPVGTAGQGIEPAAPLQAEIRKGVDAVEPVASDSTRIFRIRLVHAATWRPSSALPCSPRGLRSGGRRTPRGCSRWRSPPFGRSPPW